MFPFLTFNHKLIEFLARFNVDSLIKFFMLNAESEAAFTPCWLSGVKMGR